MMAGAKRELADAIDELQESQAEIVLSLVHFLRARRLTGPAMQGAYEQDTTAMWDWVRALLALRVVEGSVPQDELTAMLEQLEPGAGSQWSSLTEPVLARDWNRPEEDAAWADL